VLALCATAAWAANVYSENVGPGTLAVGNRGDSWAKFRVTGASGALTAVPTATTGTAWSIDARTLTSGNAVKIVADDDILNGGYYVNFLGGATGTDSVFSIGELGAIDSTGTIDVWADGLVAGGDRAIVGAITQSTAVALTGTLVGVYARATGGDTGGAGTVRGCEIGGRVTDSTGKIASVVTGGYFWADAKQRQATTLRGLEVSLDGGGSATSTLATGVQVFNNSSGTQTTSIAYDINEGNPNGRKAFTYDFRGQNAETWDNATNGTWQLTAGVLKHAYDAAAYWTATQADAGAVTFDSVSDGTPSFAFSDKVTVTHSQTAAADVGTVRAMYGKYALTGSTPVTTASNNLVGARGEFNIATGGVLSFNAGSSFASGVQGKIVASGTTTIGATTGHQDARIQAVHGQLDLTGMTINGGQVSIAEFDVQVRPAAINGVNQFNLLKITDPSASTTAQAASIIYAYAEAGLLFDLVGPENTADWIYGGAHTQASGSTNCLKIAVNGTVYYIALYDSTPGS